MTIETEEQLEALKIIGQIVADTLYTMGRAITPGMTTKELDEIGQAKLASYGAQSAPILMYQFPGATCISVNNEVAHGIPGDRVIQAGDMVNIDVSAELNGFFGDTGASFLVPPYNDEQKAVCLGTQMALMEAIKHVKAGQPINIIGKTIESVAQKYGFSIILNLGSHGVGASLHEEPLFIPSYYDAEDTRILTEGMVITIEPFLSTGAWEVLHSNDGWTLYTPPEFYTAQYEHTMVVQKEGALILTHPPAAA